MPAALKAGIDQIVRPGRTVEVDENKLPDPYVPLLADRPRHAVILSARGGIGFGPGGEMAHMNHLEPNLVTALNFIGITRIHQLRSEEHTSELQSLMRISYSVFCLKKKK